MKSDVKLFEPTAVVSLAESEVSAEAPPPRSGLIWVYGAWSLLASLLIFWVELMAAKMLLPRFGGSASVWNTALVFFQVNLLAGYAVAHFLRRLDSRWHKLLQTALVVLPVLTLPVALPSFLESQTTAPTLAVLASLTLMVGAPFFALSTSTPTLQAWFSHSTHPQASDPYFLYALSNVGSLFGLLAYPILIERTLTIGAQTALWTVGYGVFAGLTVAGARLVGRWGHSRHVETESPPLRRRLTWSAFAFVPSLALLGVTRHISTDVAAFPLMWTIPLVLYLASFVVTFRKGGERWARLGERALRVLAVPAVLAVLMTNVLWFTVTVPLALLAAVSLAGHGRVYRDRPEAGSLTSFYLWVSIGGAAGGLFASLVAPAVFDFVVEYPLTLVLAAFLAGPALRSKAPDRRVTIPLILAGALAGVLITQQPMSFMLLGGAGLITAVWFGRLWLGTAVAVGLIAVSIQAGSDVVASERTFYGVYRVHETEQLRYIVSGTTLHGMQFVGGAERSTPLSYYHPDGPAGEVFSAFPTQDVGIVGLGVGSLTSYGDWDDRYTYYEIDPVVEQLARDESFFTLLSESAPTVEVVIGDGRLELERMRPSHDLLVVDAFSSDSIPVHLLTLEAFETYLESIDESGILLVHISNRHLDLEAVVGRIAEELGASARVRRYAPEAEHEWLTGSVWALIERGPSLDLTEKWEAAEVGDVLWTDDYSNILSVIDWS